MSAQSQPRPDDERWPEWLFRLDLHEPDRCASRLATSLLNDPFDILGFTAVAFSYLRDGFGELVEWLAEHEPVLEHALPAVASAMNLPIERFTPGADETGGFAPPEWLRNIDQIECTGVMRRYDLANRTASSYLIEATLPGGHMSTGRLSLSHGGGVDRVSEFWTTAMSIGKAARFYRKRYTGYTTRPYRHVKADTACRRILDALLVSLEPNQFAQDWGDPIPWPQNAAVLLLMLRPLDARIEPAHDYAPK